MNSTTVAKGNQLERRLISFAAAVLALSTKLPRTPQGRHVCGQILRSGTAAAANYGEARGAESRADFIHKLKVVFKELNETTIWLEAIVVGVQPDNLDKKTASVVSCELPCCAMSNEAGELTN